MFAVMRANRFGRRRDLRDAHVVTEKDGSHKTVMPMLDFLRGALIPEAYRAFMRDQEGQIGRATNVMMSVLPSSTIAMPDFNAFAAELPRFQEIVRWTIYHYRAYPTGGSTQLQFFDQSDSVGREFTNMKAVSQFPGNEMFVAVSLGILPLPAQ